MLVDEQKSYAVIWISATLALTTPCSSTVQGFKRLVLLVLQDIGRENQGKLLSFVILISTTQSLKLNLSLSGPALVKSQRGKDGGRGLATWSSLAKNPLRAGCYSDVN